MLFSSMVFLWIFLPIVITINYLLNLILCKSSHRIHVKNVFLLTASLVFYGWGGLDFLMIMISSIIINFFGGLFISITNENKKFLRGFILFIFITINLLILFYYKYFNMLVVALEQMAVPNQDTNTTLYNIMNMKRTWVLPFKDVILPIGISFFTFQAMSYVIDVFMGKAKVQKNIFDFGLYVALFPQLIAGPIVKYSDIALQIGDREENIEKFARGIKRFCYGLGKKVIIANTFAVIVDNIWSLELANLGAVLAWAGAISYTIQIYFDFSGYSDMAIGLGLFFGFDFKENFNYPYLATSIIDFWRRWHISLSSWFKEYVYIPLGGNRKGVLRTYINLFIVFLLTGIWHGANWTFIIWGISYAIIEIIERLFLGKILKWNKIKIINVAYTFFIVVILWIPFRANNIEDAITYINQLFISESKYSILSYLSMRNIILFIAAILCMGLLKFLFGNIYNKIKNNFIVYFIDYAIQIGILIYSIMLLTSGTYNPFIYFQF